MHINRQLLAASWRSYWSQDLVRAGPYWLQILWSVLIAMAVGLVFTLLGFVRYAKTVSDWLSVANWLVWYPRNLIISGTIIAIIHVLFEVGFAAFTRQRIRRFNRWQRTLFFSGIPAVGVYTGWPLGYALAGGQVGDFFTNTNSIVGSLLFSGLMTLLMAVYWSSRHRETQAQAMATEARLKLLQAQIEPHFLFNTLANVVSLMDYDTPRAKQMLESFIDYLRASLSQLRRDDSSLGAELDMAHAYLALLQTRMAERLRYRIEASDACRAARVPPLLLQPLVENAIQHGLEPKVDGGEVIIRAELDGKMLHMSVQDDGLGLEQAASRKSGGTGLAVNNIRERLQSRWGNEASLDIRSLEPGVLATLSIPFTTTPNHDHRPDR
ncbi:sensor histidine kinase [Piscinibacter terrae]|uniref:Sensor histidine kinase n=1 Tax=Piscinibacter terrae TaxID=2496871 RepID=A0A3N7HTK2_9BURK|nr:histidine kinase [Albitalea terrae]RQP25648.1 sensor histidine kinase [Albitalea terrae]